MSNELLTLYRAWLGEPSAVPAEPIPLGNLDIFEDDLQVVNRLFWAIPLPARDSMRLFLFFEENSFLKDPAGDLVLLSSSLHPYTL